MAETTRGIRLIDENDGDKAAAVNDALRDVDGQLSALDDSNLATQDVTGGTATKLRGVLTNIWAPFANATAFGKSLLGAANAAALRALAGLGNSATRNVGPGPADVPAGNHGHSSIENGGGSVTANTDGSVTTIPAAGKSFNVGVPGNGSLYVGSNLSFGGNYDRLDNSGGSGFFTLYSHTGVGFTPGGGAPSLLTRVGGTTIGRGYAAAGAQLHVSNTNATQPSGIFQGAPGQTANLSEWQDSSGNVKSFVSAAGDYCLRDTTNGFTYKIQCTNGVLGVVQI